MAEKKKGGATKNKVNSGDILRSVMKIRGYTSASLARQMKYEVSSYVTNRVNADDLKLSTMAMLLEEMKYQIVIQPIGADVASDEFVLKVLERDGGPE